MNCCLSNLQKDLTSWAMNIPLLISMSPHSHTAWSSWWIISSRRKLSLLTLQSTLEWSSSWRALPNEIRSRPPSLVTSISLRHSRGFVLDSLPPQPNSDYNQYWNKVGLFFFLWIEILCPVGLPAHVINTTAIDDIESQKTCKNGGCHT